MNRTQKGAVISLIGILFNVLVLVFVFTELFVIKRFFQSPWEKFWVPVAALLSLPAFMIFYYRRQSRLEVESDERDNIIKKNAGLICFVLTWVMLGISTITLQFTVGIEGCIPLWLFPFINLGIFLLVMIVYNAAILVQYGRGGKNGRN